MKLGDAVKRCRWIAIAILFAETVSAQGVMDRIEQELSRGQLSRSRALYYQALRIVDPGSLPGTLMPLDELPVKDGTGIAFQIRNLWHEFSMEEQRDLGLFMSRPDMPFSYISPGNLFRIHYNIEGNDAVPPGDNDFSGIPDYVEECSNAFEYSYSVEVGRLGLNPPPDDRNVDGPEWDIYLINTPGVYGWTNPENLISRNPDTYTSYVTMDNDFVHTPTKGVDGMRVTAAHELYHLIQLGYVGRDENNDGGFDDLFLMEAGATWMEDVVYDHINDYYYYLPYFFNRSNVPLDRTDGRWEYGLCIWFHFMEKQLGTSEIGRIIWENLVDVPAIEALDRVFSQAGSSFESELSRFYGWNLMTGARADTSRFYPEGIYYPSVSMDAVYRLADTTLTVRIQPKATRYFEFEKGDGISFFLAPAYTDMSGDAEEGECTLLVSRSADHVLYTHLLEDWHTRQIAEDYVNWKSVAVVSGQGLSLFYQFNANRSGITEENLPASFPSPFNLARHSVVTLPFILEEMTMVRLMIVSSAGFSVHEDEKQFDRGLQFYTWDGKDEKGGQVPSGVYLYLLLQDDALLRKEKIAVVR